MSHGPDLHPRLGRQDGPLQRLDARVKLIASLVVLLVIVSVPAGYYAVFAASAVMIGAGVIASRAPLRWIIKRSLGIAPFVLMVAVFVPFARQGDAVWSLEAGPWTVSITDRGLAAFAVIMVKAWLSLLTLVLLSATTELEDILKAMGRLGMPRVFTLTISFMYRYLYVIGDEATRMRQAWESRRLRARSLRDLGTLSNIVGTLFIRSYERSERVYQAMVARGFDGEVRGEASWKRR